MRAMASAVLEWTESRADKWRATPLTRPTPVPSRHHPSGPAPGQLAWTPAEECWKLHDFLSIQRHEIEGRFDFRLSGLLFVFASLVKDGLLQLDELQGLEPDKLNKVAAMARM